MTDNFPKSPVRIPVKLVDEQWEFFYGGKLLIKNGAVGDLVIDKNDITDKKFLAQLTRTSEHKILEADIELLVALTIKTHFEANNPLGKYLIPISEHRDMLASEFFHTIRSSQTRFVKVTIGEPTPRQKRIRPDDTGEFGFTFRALSLKAYQQAV